MYSFILFFIYLFIYDIRARANCQGKHNHLSERNRLKYSYLLIFECCLDFSRLDYNAAKAQLATAMKSVGGLPQN